MNHFVKDISIENFKSIQKIEIKDCSRINIFIGEPNVGKSNILEALAIAGLPFNYSMNFNYLTECVRNQSKTDLYHNGNINEYISIDVLDYESNKIHIAHFYDENKFVFEIDKIKANAENKKKPPFLISVEGNYEELKSLWKIEGFLSQKFPIFKYLFLPNLHSEIGSLAKTASHLFAPLGKNLSSVLASNKDLMREIQELFIKYDQKLVLDRNGNSIKILKNTNTEDGFVFLLPYSSVADSLQRLIFYKAAVASNKDRILLFEEPEAHTFPPYISKLTHDITQSITNQFFITTHSPVIVSDFLENAQEDLSVFMVDFKNDQTVVHKLTKEEIHRVYQYGIDLFYNYESFIGA